jgi:hypothetical protein
MTGGCGLCEVVTFRVCVGVYVCRVRGTSFLVSFL